MKMVERDTGKDIRQTRRGRGGRREGLQHRPVVTLHISSPVTFLFLEVEGRVGWTLNPGHHPSVVALVEAATVSWVSHIPVAGPFTRLVHDGACSG